MKKINRDVLYYLYRERRFNVDACAIIMNVHRKTIKRHLFDMKLLEKKKKENEKRDQYGRYIQEGQILPPFESHHHPNYTDGSGSYRQRALRNYENKCHYCHSTDNIHIHHIDKNRSNNELSNLRPVCSKCHFHIEHYDKKRDKHGRFTK